MVCVCVYLLQLHFLRLPSNIAEFHVVLMDATIATGAAAIMAIRILLVRPMCLILYVVKSLQYRVERIFFTPRKLPAIR